MSNSSTPIVGFFGMANKDPICMNSPPSPRFNVRVAKELARRKSSPIYHVAKKPRLLQDSCDHAEASHKGCKKTVTSMWEDMQKEGSFREELLTLLKALDERTSRLEINQEENVRVIENLHNVSLQSHVTIFSSVQGQLRALGDELKSLRAAINRVHGEVVLMSRAVVESTILDSMLVENLPPMVVSPTLCTPTSSSRGTVLPSAPPSAPHL